MHPLAPLQTYPLSLQPRSIRSTYSFLWGDVYVIFNMLYPGNSCQGRTVCVQHWTIFWSGHWGSWRQAQWETVIGLRIVLEWRQVEVGGSQQVQLRPCDEGCFVVVVLDSSLFWPFQQKSSWAEWLAYISSCDPPPPLSCTSIVIYTQELLAFIARQTPPARVFSTRVCAWTCLHDRDFCMCNSLHGWVPNSACMCVFMVYVYVCACGCSLMLHIDFNICDTHAAVTYLTLFLPGQPEDHYYCCYFTVIFSFFLFSWFVLSLFISGFTVFTGRHPQSTVFGINGF